MSLFRRGKLISGNFRGHFADPFHAWTGMWGLYRSKTLRATSSMRVFSNFPQGTIFSWDVTSGSDWKGVNGYLHVSYGNYDGGPARITPRRVGEIKELSLAIDWDQRGDLRSGLLAECWLTATPHRAGDLTDKVAEVGFMPRLSRAASTWVESLPFVGKFEDSNGISWEVRKSESGTGEPYFIAYRPGFQAFRGTLRFDQLFRFLRSQGQISSSSWVNGIAFGVEPHVGAGSLTIKKFVPRSL